MSGPGVHPVRVFAARTVTEADLAIAFLQGLGVPALVESPHIRAALDGIADIMEQQTGIWVVVPSDRAEEASAAIREFESRPPVEEDEVPPDGSEE